jgi:hypothetical protein
VVRPWFLLIPPLALACGDVGLTVFEPAEGPRPGGGVVVEGAVHQGSPALALDGDDTILVWAEPTPTGRDAHVRAARVRPSDEVVRGKSVLDRSVYDLRLWARPADWLLSWQEGSRASLLSLTRELDAFDRQSVPSGSSSSDLRAVRDGDAMYAVWTANVDNDYDVWGGRVGDDNVVRADTAGTLTPGRTYEYAPAIAQVGGRNLVVWLRFGTRVNYNYDIAGRWLTEGEPSFYLELDRNQSNLVAVGGQAVALVLWWDALTGGLVATRARPDGSMVDRAPVPLWPTATPRAAAVAVPGGFVIVGHGLRDGVPTLRLLHLDEAARIEPERAVWLAGGQVGDSDDRPALALDTEGRGMVAFTYAVPTSTVVRARRIALGALGEACRAARDCLTSRCVSGQCAEE